MHGRRSSLKHLSDKKELSKYLPIKLGIKRNTFSFIFPNKYIPKWQKSNQLPPHSVDGNCGIPFNSGVGWGWGLAHWVHHVPTDTPFYRPCQNYSSRRLGFQLLCHLTRKKDPYTIICFLGSGDLPRMN